MTTEEQSVLESLDGFVAEIDGIMSLIGEKRRLSGADARTAQEKLKTLKERLRAESRRTQREESELGSPESAFYAPAVQEAITRIQVQTNWTPDHRWVSSLYDARGSLSYYAHGLREKRAQNR